MVVEAIIGFELFTLIVLGLDYVPKFLTTMNVLSTKGSSPRYEMIY
jgi:hypothetical protein